MAPSDGSIPSVRRQLNTLSWMTRSCATFQLQYWKGEVPRPVFVVCQNRVGSTFLNRLLSGHPACWTYQLGEHQEAMDHPGCPRWLSRTPFLNRWKVKTCNRFDAIKTRWWTSCVAAGASVGVFKIPHALTKVLALQAALPDVAFILLIRNPIDQMASALATGNPLENLTVTADALLDFVKNEQDRVKRLHVVRYEKLVVEPQQELSRMLHFLDLPTTTTILNQCISRIEIKSAPQYTEFTLPKEMVHRAQHLAELLDYETPTHHVS